MDMGWVWLWKWIGIWTCIANGVWGMNDDGIQKFGIVLGLGAWILIVFAYVNGYAFRRVQKTG